MQLKDRNNWLLFAASAAVASLSLLSCVNRSFAVTHTIILVCSQVELLSAVIDNRRRTESRPVETYACQMHIHRTNRRTILLKANANLQNANTFLTRERVHILYATCQVLSFKASENFTR